MENAKPSSGLGCAARESITPALPKRHADAGRRRLIRAQSIVADARERSDLMIAAQFD
jgi:hypothetical protein